MSDRLGALSAPDRDHSDHGGTWPVCLPRAPVKRRIEGRATLRHLGQGSRANTRSWSRSPWPRPPGMVRGRGLHLCQGLQTRRLTVLVRLEPQLATPPLRDGAKDGVKRGAYYGSGER